MQAIHVLLVDDDKTDIELTKRALENGQLNLSINTVNNGVEALDFLKNNPEKPDLILLDLNMPRMDGRETLEALKKDSNLKEIPVAILTTSSDTQDINESYTKGCTCFITKPANIKDFEKTVSAIKNFWFSIVKLPNR